MNEIPSMWRTELIHPLFVHFPIAILLLSAVVGVGYLIFNRLNFAGHLRFTLSLLLWLGIVFFWITLYTGQLAYTVEVRKICDPTVLQEHSKWAWYSGYIFSAATALDILQRTLLTSFKKIISLLLVTLLLGGAASLSYTGHLGASVVYQQGAGVYHPSENCAEFE